MAYDATKPAVADNYSTGYTQTIRDNFDFLLKLGEASGSSLTVTGTPPTGAKRYNPSTDLFEQYIGGWTAMPLAYLGLTGGGTVGGTVNFSSTLQEAGSRVWTAATFDPGSKANNANPTMTGNGTIAGTFAAGARLFGNGSSGNNGLGKVTITSTTTAPTGGSQGAIHVIW